MRRTLLLLACLLFIVAPAAAENLSVLPEKIDGVEPSGMMHAHLLKLVRSASERRRLAYEKLKTPEEIAAYQKRLREFFVAQLGGFPERTPLEPRVVGTLDRGDYRVEKVIYQSQPRLYVTALLFLPKTKAPYPGVLVPCGHEPKAKACEAYQRLCILLARNGIAALIYDPIEQGERFQLLDEHGKPRVGVCEAHNLVGVGSILLGRNTATFRIWDGMRGIDYLQSRPEIDPRRIGCTGNSGGGTLTSHLMALDPRVGCAAPSCYLSSLERIMETIGPADAEQNIHAQIAYGMDHADYCIMRAARPTLMCTATRDYFDIGGSWDSFRQAQRIYTRLDRSEAMSLIEADEEHGLSQPLRVGAVRWMRRWLLGANNAITEPHFPVLTEQESRSTPRGQVMLLEGARTTYDLNNDLETRLAKTRKNYWRTTDKTVALDKVRQITGIRRLADLAEPKWEKVGTIDREGYRIDKLVLKPEPGIWLPAIALVPPKPSGEAYLYLNEAGKAADAAPGGPMERLVRQGHIVLAVDLRGLGETQSARSDTYSHRLGPNWPECFMAYLLDTSYLAMRAEDVIRSAHFLAGYERGDKPNRVHLVSIGLTGPPALHAAALEPQLLESVALKKCLVSWSDVVHTPLACNQFVNVVHGALATYDLPDLLSTLPAGKVTIAEPLNAMEKPLKP